MRARRIIPAVLFGLTLLAPVTVGGSSQAATGNNAGSGTAQVTIIQALPGTAVDVTLDGDSVARGSAVGDILGPFDLKPGTHEVTFTGAAGLVLASTMDVTAGSSSDVVLHLPADVGGDPVVHSYAAPVGGIGPGKARVVLAHTATVAPADVRVDGTIVFTNIANGEFAEAELPAGTHRVALLPTGSTTGAILGPLDLAVDAGTLSMLYAYGNPRDGSMNVIAHTSTLDADGTAAPDRIDTGSAGLASDPVTRFSYPATGADPGHRPWAPVLAVLLTVALAAAGLIGVPLSRRRPAHGVPASTA